MPHFHPHPHAPDPPSPTRWLQQSLAQSAEARQQVGDTEDAAVSPQCTVAEHRTLLLPALIHLCSLPPNCRCPTTLKASKNNLESYWNYPKNRFSIRFVTVLNEKTFSKIIVVYIRVSLSIDEFVMLGFR
jgi:hypothetical protein